MNLLHPWALAIGALAVGLPVVIHWLTRPRPRRVALSTVRFVEEAVQQKRAKWRLRDLLVLLLRTAAVVLVAWAFARPLIGDRPLIAAGEPGDAVRIVILDQSQSMAAVSGGITPFERARTIAADYLAYQSGLRGNLILAGARPRATFEQISSNFGAMREQLARAEAQPERLEVQSALTMAADLLAQGDEQSRREVVIISDFQRSNWVSADFSALPRETVIQFESVAPAEAPANLGIVRVGMTGRLERNRPVRLEVEVGNYSPTPREVQVEVLLGEAAYRLSGACPAGVSTTLSTEVTLRQSGWLAGEARIVGVSDALSADDVRAFVVDVRATPTYALVTRESARPRASSSHYLERALAPFSGFGVQGSGFSSEAASERRTLNPEPSVERVVRIAPEGLDREALAGVSVIVLDRPGKLSEAQINLLTGLLRRGRGVLYVASEPVDAVNLAMMSESAGREMRLPVEFVPPAVGQTPGYAARSRGLGGRFLVEWNDGEAPFAAFGEDLPGALSGLRFAGGLETRRVEGGLMDDVLATYSDRSACLVVTTCGAGTLAVLNADLAESNLAASAVFVPLVGELVGRLLETPGSASLRRGVGDDSVGCGEAVAVYLPVEVGSVEGLRIARKDEGRRMKDEGEGGSSAGESEMGELSEEGGFVLWRWGSAGRPGVYEVRREGATVFSLATAVPGSESNLEPLDPEVLTVRLAGGRRVQYRSAGGEQQEQDDVWAWILAMCAMCMIGELVVLRAFRT